MHNKTLKCGLAVVAIATVLVGGTFAWLGSSDSVINLLKTEASKKSEVEIYEDFESAKALSIKTGEKQAINKQVQVQNNCDYNSLLRVKLIPRFVDSDGDRVDIDTKYIKIAYTEGNVSLDGSDTSVGKWVKVEDTNDDSDSYFYYIGNVAPNYFTNKIIDKVWLDPTLTGDEEYKSLKDKNIHFEVEVIAEGVPSTEEAITSKETIDDGKSLGFGLDENTNKALVEALKTIVKVDSKYTNLSGGNSNKFSDKMEPTINSEDIK